MTLYFRLIAALLLAPALALHAVEFPANVRSIPSIVIALEPNGKTVLMVDDAKGAAALVPFKPGVKRLWMGNWQTISQTLVWKMAAHEEADYEVAMVSKDVPGVSLDGGIGGTLLAEIKTSGWARHELARSV